MYKHLMLPTDGSELSEGAAREGVRFAKSIGAQLTALHATPVFYPTELHAHTAPERPPSRHDKNPQLRTREHFLRFAAKHRALRPGVAPVSGC